MWEVLVCREDVIPIYINLLNFILAFLAQIHAFIIGRIGREAQLQVSLPKGPNASHHATLGSVRHTGNLKSPSVTNLTVTDDSIMMII